MDIARGRKALGFLRIAENVMLVLLAEYFVM